jgi:hypothetical protein
MLKNLSHPNIVVSELDTVTVTCSFFSVVVSDLTGFVWPRDTLGQHRRRTH